MLWANINMSGEWISPLNRSTAHINGTLGDKLHLYIMYQNWSFNKYLRNGKGNYGGNKVQKEFFLSEMPQNCFYHKIAACVIGWISVSVFSYTYLFEKSMLAREDFSAFYCFTFGWTCDLQAGAGDHIQVKTHIGARNFWSLIMISSFFHFIFVHMNLF